VTVNDPRGTGAPDGASDLNGILGSVLGESSDDQKRRIEAAMQQATDLTGLVKKKRKAEGDPGTGTETPEKRARTEETEEGKAA
jgi:HAT1-interacting factor 1